MTTRVVVVASMARLGSDVSRAKAHRRDAQLQRLILAGSPPWPRYWLRCQAAERRFLASRPSPGLRTTLGGGMRPESVGTEDARTVAERSLESHTVEALWKDGQRMSLEEAISEVLETPNSLTSV